MTADRRLRSALSSTVRIVLGQVRGGRAPSWFCAAQRPRRRESAPDSPVAAALQAALLITSLVLAAQTEPAAAQQEAVQPIVRARLAPGDSVTVGQPITVDVEVLVPTFFTGAPDFSDLDVPGALVIFNDRGRNLNERRDRRTWSGQSRSYTVYPQRPGSYDISGIEVDVPYSAGGATGTTARISVDPLRFEATVPPGAEGLGYFIATSELDISQDVTARRTGSQRVDGAGSPAGGGEPPADQGEPPAGAAGVAQQPEQSGTDASPAGDTNNGSRTLRVGDSLTRTVTVTVQDALSMVVPPLDLGAPDGLAAYPASPTVQDSGGERGERPVGTRRESTTFVAESEGNYRLPAVELSWWDVAAQQLRQSAVSAIDVEVVANPDLAADFVLADDTAAAGEEATPATRIDLAAYARRYALPLLLVIVSIAAIARLARRFGLRVPHPWAVDPAARAEAHRFRDFRRAARSGQARDTARTFMRWLDSWYRRPGTYAEFSAAAADPEMDRQSRALADALYAVPDHRSGTWSGRALAHDVRRARRTARKADSAEVDPPLPPLNP